eukprot:CCRYP_002128-RA/>CCRYP_002128-RA protein AED:0.24 eAED:0.29 QI:0/0/0.5/1/0/0/2/580/61
MFKRPSSDGSDPSKELSITKFRSESASKPIILERKPLQLIQISKLQWESTSEVIIAKIQHS